MRPYQFLSEMVMGTIHKEIDVQANSSPLNVTFVIMEQKEIVALPKSIGKTNVPVIFLYIGQIFDKDNLKAKNNAIFVLEREFLDLRKNILSNSKITF